MSYDDDGNETQNQGTNRPDFSVTLRVNVWQDGGLSVDLSRKNDRGWVQLGGAKTRSTVTMSNCASEYAKLAVSMAAKYRKDHEKKENT